MYKIQFRESLTTFSNNNKKLQWCQKRMQNFIDVFWIFPRVLVFSFSLQLLNFFFIISGLFLSFRFGLLLQVVWLLVVNFINCIPQRQSIDDIDSLCYFVVIFFLVYFKAIFIQLFIFSLLIFNLQNAQHQYLISNDHHSYIAFFIFAKCSELL